MFGEWPNSTGQFRVRQTIISDGSAINTIDSPNGAFGYGEELDPFAEGLQNRSNSKNVRSQSIDIDLSRSSDIYSGSKMQPTALQVLACIRF